MVSYKNLQKFIKWSMIIIEWSILTRKIIKNKEIISHVKTLVVNAQYTDKFHKNSWDQMLLPTIGEFIWQDCWRMPEWQKSQLVGILTILPYEFSYGWPQQFLPMDEDLPYYGCYPKKSELELICTHIVHW